ncbi:MAG: hypothetical protein JNL38_23080 [Myxococcales bacterium]|nr:hypothetical protein [Myxococcales bacterium]
MATSEPSTPYWRLLSVLFSSFPLTPALAYRLLRAAYELYRFDREVMALGGDVDLILTGEMRNLKRDVALGTFVGPAFEAQVETERGKGTIRFVVTREGIAEMAERATATLN